MPAGGQHAVRETAAAREQQWLYRETLGEGTPEATAVFLSWNYEAVIFTATCDRNRNELVLRYHLEPEWEVTGAQQIYLASGEQSVALTTTHHGRVLEARTQLTPELRALLTRGDEMEIDAPNDMGEPWYVGRAESLRKVALSCG